MSCSATGGARIVRALTDDMNLNASIALELFFVKQSMYTSLCRKYMKVTEPSVRTGA
jgi:hypothetical protein